MRHALRFLVPLLLFLGALASVASSLINTTSRRWFDRDVTLRAQLAVSGAREGLSTHWRSSNPAGIARVLTEIALDERVMATANVGVRSADIRT